MASTGLSADPTEYRARLADQSDDQIDTWAAELMRDVVIRRGIVKVVDDFRRATRLDERGFERVFASGGGPPAVIGRDAKGRLVVPTVTLVRPRPRDPGPGPGRPRPPGRIPGRELRRDRLRLRRPGAVLGGVIRLGHPFPSLLDGVVVSAIALIAGADPWTAVRLGRLDDRAPGLDRHGQRHRRRAARPRGASPPSRSRRRRLARGLAVALAIASGGLGLVACTERRGRRSCCSAIVVLGHRLRLRPAPSRGRPGRGCRSRSGSRSCRSTAGSGRREACRHRSRSSSRSRSSPARPWPSPTRGPTRTGTARPARCRSRPGSDARWSWWVDAILLAAVVVGCRADARWPREAPDRSRWPSSLARPPSSRRSRRRPVDRTRAGVNAPGRSRPIGVALLAAGWLAGVPLAG